MKTRIVVVTVVCAIAGLLGWFLNSPPAADTSVSATDAAAKTADVKATAKVEAPKANTITAPVAPVRPAQVAKPVVTAAVPKNAPATQAADTFVAAPQSDLKTCVATMAHFLEAHDILSLVKTIMPPDAINRMIQSGQATSIEDVAEHYRQMPDVTEKMDQLLWALQNIESQGQEPEISTDGTNATYKIDQQISGPGKAPAPAGTPGTLGFIKVDGNWYMR